MTKSGNVSGQGSRAVLPALIGRRSYWLSYVGVRCAVQGGPGRTRSAAMRAKRPLVVASALLLGALVALVAPSPAHGAVPRVLRVGSWHGIAGTYTSVQTAARAAH